MGMYTQIGPIGLTGGNPTFYDYVKRPNKFILPSMQSPFRFDFPRTENRVKRKLAFINPKTGTASISRCR